MDTHESRVRRIVNLSGLAAGALLLSVLAACGAGDGGSGEESAAPTSAAPTSAPESTEESPVPEETTPYLDPSAGEPSKSSGSETTISGTVEAGVEAGCLVLEHGGTVYGIYGSFDASVVYAGASVTLHGKVDNDMMTTCQQGTPFVVEEAEAAG